ncbi:MAG: ATP-grasp domain-containing protein, partial [Clostridia bacterium]|nr:ATP-grasp domain-containing protein [Clostridia bacterium]
NFKSNVIVPYSDYDFLEELMDKEKFYALCEKHGIDYPKTYICTARDYENVNVHFDAPYILKPANQVEYYKHKFEGQKKVFKIDTKEELEDVIKKVYAAGYTDNMIVQDFLPGDDTYLRVLTSYSDKNGKVKMMCLGHVLLEEHTPYGIGNHAVIITEYEPELMEKFKVLLEEIGYKGFSNFDIKYDYRDKKYKAFEINTRQGRSNFYVTGSGHNIAELLVEDFIYNNPIEEDIAKNEHLWMVVPKGVAYKYAPEYKDRMKRLIKTGKYVNPLRLKEDNDIERLYRLGRSQLAHYMKFKKYYKK